jgi:hypothetical protein
LNGQRRSTGQGAGEQAALDVALRVVGQEDLLHTRALGATLTLGVLLVVGEAASRGHGNVGDCKIDTDAASTSRLTRLPASHDTHALAPQSSSRFTPAFALQTSPSSTQHHRRAAACALYARYRLSRLRRYSPVTTIRTRLPTGASRTARRIQQRRFYPSIPLPSPSVSDQLAPFPSPLLARSPIASTDHRRFRELAGLSGGPVMASTTTPSISQDTALPRDLPRGRRVA